MALVKLLVLVVLMVLLTYLPCVLKELCEPSAPRPNSHAGSVVEVHCKIGRLFNEVEGEIPSGREGVDL